MVHFLFPPTGAETPAVTFRFFQTHTAVSAITTQHNVRSCLLISCQISFTGHAFTSACAHTYDTTYLPSV